MALKSLKTISALALASISFYSQAKEVTYPDSIPMQAPLAKSIRTSYWTFEYTYTRTTQNGLLAGNSAVNPESVLQSSNYTKLPYTGNDCSVSTLGCGISNLGYRLNGTRHWLKIKYQQNTDLSWMAKFNYLSNYSNAYDKPNATATTTSLTATSGGISDIQLFMTKKFQRSYWVDISFTIGLNIPLGSINQVYNIKDEFGNTVTAPYYLQLGSGTYDIITALNFDGSYQSFDYEFQLSRVNRTGLNLQYYNFGDTLDISGKGKYTFSFGTQLRGGLIQHIWSPIEGQDERISYNTRYSGGKRLDLLMGVGQDYKDFSVYLDYYYPLLQYLNGVQMKTTGILSLGLSYKYK